MDIWEVHLQVNPNGKIVKIEKEKGK
jgi:diacylglycerol kinase (ATP)